MQFIILLEGLRGKTLAKDKDSTPQTNLPAFQSEAAKKSPRQRRSRKGEGLILAGVIILLVDAFLFNVAVVGRSLALALDVIIVIGLALIVAGVLYRRSKLHKV